MDSLQQKARYQVGGEQVHLAKKLQTPQFVGETPSTIDWKRTTIVRVDGKRQLYEMCENLNGLDNQQVIEAIEDNARRPMPQ